ncbi:uncharacterized protein LOC106673338 [Cimex lectularius]|uniref:Reverse transcriptase domain-containing protein n=1 Tax=Cimex lectularius TaxID=79782 RepID=A0A8I6SBA6_CIMLE|nr:uncharacterized protein LOC106673338 [Cimex lectularius]
MAMKRFFLLEKKLDKNKDLNAAYIDFMEEHVKLKHMEVVKEPYVTDVPTYYMPHHCVHNIHSSTTKYRVVFDASVKTTSGLSLNDALMTGPVIQQDLVSIILRFRSYKYVITADITKMYRQIKISEEDKSLHRIFWRKSPNQPLIEYQLNTVTYGTAPASFLATRCLQQAAREQEDKYASAVRSILQDFYMDDYLTGCNDFENLKLIQEEVIKILEGAQFSLHQWCANELALLDKIPTTKTETKFIPNEEDISIKTLGIWWNPEQDYFTFSIFLPPEQKPTKRSILSDTAKVFDPLGLVGPVIVKFKMFLQVLWSLKTEWDEALSTSQLMEWTSFRKDLKFLETLHIPRPV